MRALPFICSLALLTVSPNPAVYADHPAEESAEATPEQETTEWLNSWGIKRNPDGSMQSMTAAEREAYWRSRDLKEEAIQKRRQKLETLEREQVEHDRDLVEKNPDDPDTHFQVSLNHQNRGDGEGAIIHMMKAETLYKASKNLRGMARARKALRGFYKTYGYLPEDFELTQH